MSTRIPCIECGAEILTITANTNSGLCIPCVRGTRKQMDESRNRAEQIKKENEERLKLWENRKKENKLNKNLKGIYHLKPDYDTRGNSPWDWLQYKNYVESQKVRKKSPLSDNWTPLQVSLQKEKKSGDFYFINGNYAVTREVMNILQNLLGNSVEFLRLNCDKISDLYLLHIIKHVQLSQDSGYHRDIDGNISDIYHYDFEFNKTDKNHFFYVQQHKNSTTGSAGFPASSILVTQDFKTLTEKHKFLGLSFRPVNNEHDEYYAKRPKA